ncbi:LacI family DNA-binding transcriptional regulator [Curtobacterium pusillum]|uniref:LacI family DNA-binding transcriptional regulator n=1 Tax=Curtobacterium pusillum TaxID=69373 RepID=A0ABX2M7Z2_9MICO|nr:LacI family DNA-binding transcriptional regulator [Curtobacterium pusillum]NUU14190.1 LacI family DNA-binding transcriptional regulator [Curtobacterium pusillum]GLK29934.1 LacI family transcriptional regulator [Curtobacterium pusillum]
MQRPRTRAPGVATVADVAREAGVSRATVSRVINDSPLVTPQTKDLVQDAIRRTGFVVNARGRALAIGRAETVGVLITEPLDELFEDPTYARILRGVTEGLSGSGTLPVIFQASTEAERALALRSFDRKAVDAVIHLTPYRDPELLDALAGTGLPVVLCGQVENGAAPDPRFSSIYADDVAGARLAATHLAESGRDRIAAVLGPLDNPATTDRLQGFRDVLGPRLPSERVLFTGWDTSAGIRATQTLLELFPEVDAILAGSDRIAVGAIAVLNAQGRAVPSDVAIIGFDDHPIAASAVPALTTIAQPLQRQGELAAHTALQMIAGQSPTVSELDMRLVVRASG